MTKPVGAYTRKPTAEELAREATAAEAVDSVNPGKPPSGAEHQQSISSEPEEVQYTLDPQMVHQATQNKNARLIAMMVHENAMMEVALEQERRAHSETRAKLDACQAILDDDNR